MSDVRPIDADALLKRRRNFGKDYALDPVDKNIDDQLVDLRDVLNAPTLDYAPVRHGSIIERNVNGKSNRVFSCCGTDFTKLTMWMMPKYCPNCGAKMDGGKKDET